MSIRLSGAQVTRVKESLLRFDNGRVDNEDPDVRYPGTVPVQTSVEELVEDILNIALPKEAT